MEHLTWEELRDILIASGDSAALKEQVVLQAGTDGEYNLTLVIDAKAGEMAFNYAFSVPAAE